MISRKWLYTYRMLTARLHEEEQAPTNQTDVRQPRQISLNDELTENKPTKPALMLKAGTENRKMNT